MEETMKPNLLASLRIAFVIVFLLTACGQTPPTPVTNPPGVETSLASTALALAKQTEAANPFTATPSPTPTQAPTPTPKISLNGTSLVVLEDQSALFTDHKLGYQITIPAGWLPVRLNEDEYYQAFTLDAVVENPAIVDFLSKIQTQDSNHVRLTAIDIRHEKSADELISGISVVLQPGNAKTLSEWATANPPRANKRKGYQLLSSHFQETDSGIRVLVWEEKWNSTAGEKIYARRISISLPSGILTLDFETALDSKDIELPEFEHVVNSLTLLNP